MENSALGGSGAVEVRGSGGFRRPGDVVPGGEAVGHLGAIVIGGEPMAAGPEMHGYMRNTGRLAASVLAPRAHTGRDRRRGDHGERHRKREVVLQGTDFDHPDDGA